MNEWIHNAIWSVGEWSLTPQRIFAVLMVLAAGWIFRKFTKARWKQRIYKPNDISPTEQAKFERYLGYLLALLVIIGLLKALAIDSIFYPTDVNEETPFVLRISHLIWALVILISARITDWLLSNVLTHSYNEARADLSPLEAKQLEAQNNNTSKATKTIQVIVLLLAGLLLIKNFNGDFTLFEYTLKEKVIAFKFSKVIVAVLIIMVGKLIEWVLTQLIMYNLYRKRKVDMGGQFAVNQLIKYIVYFLAIIFAMTALGINMTLMLGGAAALLVGVGLGLQQTFNDFFSGLVLLFERTVEVGDMLDMNGEVGRVTKIGLRSSLIEKRSFESIIVPNSKLVNDVVNNWSHFTDKVRFQINVGVAYGSDTKLVKELLLQAATEHPLVIKNPKPWVRFTDFGNSSLDFQLLFFASNFDIVEDIRSDLRFRIDALFREHHITIPFPQRDLWIRNPIDYNQKPEA